MGGLAYRREDRAVHYVDTGRPQGAQESVGSQELELEQEPSLPKSSGVPDRTPRVGLDGQPAQVWTQVTLSEAFLNKKWARGIRDGGLSAESARWCPG